MVIFIQILCFCFPAKIWKFFIKEKSTTKNVSQKIYLIFSGYVNSLRSCKKEEYIKSFDRISCIPYFIYSCLNFVFYQYYIYIFISLNHPIYLHISFFPSRHFQFLFYLNLMFKLKQLSLN